jgi:hypothetical protein
VWLSLQETEGQLPVLLKEKNGGELFAFFGRAFLYACRFAG